jgi:hypothetical protein
MSALGPMRRAYRDRKRLESSPSADALAMGTTDASDGIWTIGFGSARIGRLDLATNYLYHL